MLFKFNPELRVQKVDMDFAVRWFSDVRLTIERVRP
jgi:hypothetical protein